MSQVVSGERMDGGRLHIARSRGAASGLLVMLLGLWGALVPFVGPVFDFAYDSDQGSAWSGARGWLEVLPGVVALAGGVLLVRSRNRATAMLGGWLSVVAGAWFVIGRVMATTLTIGEIGRPVAQTDTKAAWLELTYFYGLGALIVFLGAIALGRLSVRSVRGVGYARRHAEAAVESNAATSEPHSGRLPTQSVEREVVPRERAPWRSWGERLGRRRERSAPVDR